MQPDEKIKEGIPIKEFPGYFICPDGNVVSEKQGARRILKAGLHKNKRSKGYLIVSLTYPFGKAQTKYIHHLVAETFLPPKPFDEAILRHLDGNSLNNSVSNLAWGTFADDVQDKIDNETLAIGQKSGTHKLTELQVKEIRESHLSGAILAKLFNISQPTISMIKSGQRWRWLESKKRLEGE